MSTPEASHESAQPRKHRNRPPKLQGVRPRVLTAIMSGYCNTSHDVAEETGLSTGRCSSCMNKLISDGIILWTDRFIRIRNFKVRVFEVAA